MDLLNKLGEHGKIQNQSSIVSSAYFISPYHKHFRTQIEDGVWKYVKLALEKNYLTINSCEGHAPEDSLEITFVFYDDDKLNKFINYFNYFPIEVKVEDRFINYFNGNRFEYVELNEEVYILNNNFMMSNTQYKFVTLFSSKEWDKKENYILYCFKKILLDKYSKIKLYNLLKKLPNYESL